MAFSSGVLVSGYISIVLDCVIAAGELDGKRVVLAYLHTLAAALPWTGDA